MIVGPASSSNENESDSGSKQMRALKFKVEARCSQLQELESALITNEQRLENAIADLNRARGRQGGAAFASMWSEANDLAITTNAQAGQFNHLGIQKTFGYSKNVHDLILEANRDGAYGAHMKAYRELAESNNIQQEIIKRANLHGKLSVAALSQINSLKPTSIAQQSPDTN